MYYNDKDSSKYPMQSLGSRLRKERESQKLTIRGIADETKITVRYLEAIEADDMTAFPGEFFYRAFVRQYSRHLGVDVEEIEKQISLVSSLPIDDQIQTAPAAATSLNLTQDQQIAALRESLKTKPMRPPQDDGMSKAWLGFAFLVIVACGVYFTWRNFTPPAEDTVMAESRPPIAATSPQPTPVAQPDAPPLQAPTVAPVTEQATVPEFGKFTLTIRAKEMTWIRLTADGTRVHGGTFDGGQERTISAS